tara:strand:+ start:271 stop:2145 length:1875 start_codon:yes stop_codon:yes gene_type:complete
MCGIVGYLSSSKLINHELINDLLNSINHRGPDSRGIYKNENLSIGMNRLSIIDLENGDQPFVSDDKKVTVIFNGEIYNFQYLKKRYLADVSFKTNSDGEVILHGYRKYGLNFFNKLNGIFAIAIWDDLKKNLILTRDPSGIKPLYYLKKEDKIFFSSEIKTFIKNNISKKVNKEGLLQLFTSGYIHHPSSALKNCFQVNPSEIILISNDLTITKNKIKYEPSENGNFNYNNFKNSEEYLYSIIKDAVDRQLISDVPIGLLLSSGMDSMGLLSIVRDLGKSDNLTSYTAFYPNKDFSENILVENLCKIWNIKNQSIKIENSHIREDFHKMISTFDNFDFIPVFASKYQVCKLAGTNHKVLLAGAGGDELFSGYPTYLASHIRKRLPFSKSVFNLVKSFYKFKDQGIHLSNYEKIYRFLEGSSLSDKYFHFFWRNILSRKDFNEIEFFNGDYEKIFQNQIYYYEKFEKDYSNFDRLLSEVDLNTWLIDHALALWDKAGMAHSIEIRVPFLDLELKNNLIKIPDKIRFSKIGKKLLLRKTFESKLPKEIINFPKKGFSVPVRDWLTSNENKNFFKEIYFSLPKGIFKEQYLFDLYNRFEKMSSNESYKIWIITCLSSWMNQYNIKFE